MVEIICLMYKILKISSSIHIYDIQCSSKINLCWNYSVKRSVPYLYSVYSNRLALNEDSFACAVHWLVRLAILGLNCYVFMTKNGSFIAQWSCYFYFGTCQRTILINRLHFMKTVSTDHFKKLLLSACQRLAWTVLSLLGKDLPRAPQSWRFNSNSVHYL